MSYEAVFDSPGVNGYRVRIWPYLLGQFRIQIIDEKRPDYLAPGEGQIVREMCTYDRAKAMAVAYMLLSAAAPEELAESWATPHNCEGRGARIRLDSQQEKP